MTNAEHYDYGCNYTLKITDRQPEVCSSREIKHFKRLDPVSSYCLEKSELHTLLNNSLYTSQLEMLTEEPQNCISVSVTMNSDLGSEIIPSPVSSRHNGKAILLSLSVQPAPNYRVLKSYIF